MEAPHILFNRWYEDAVNTEPRVPDAMQLATMDSTGRPRVRTVLMKSFEERSLVFYTNYNSSKGKQLDGHPQVTACFHWKGIARQVILSGTVRRVSDEVSDAYFSSRSRGSKLGAWASNQSAPIESREALIEKVDTIRKRFEGQDVPRPPFWGGYCITIDHWEFWQDQDDRLHDRWIYDWTGQGWDRKRVQP